MSCVVCILISSSIGVGIYKFSSEIWKKLTDMFSWLAPSKIPDKAPCASNERDDGTGCWVDTYTNGVGTPAKKHDCGPGERDDGTSCWKDTYTRGSGYAVWDKDKCERENSQGCEQYGGPLGQYYPKCRDGFHARDCCLCEPDGGGARIVKTVFDRYYCDSGQTNFVGVCYPNCREGYEFAGGNFCQPIGGPKNTKKAWDRYKCPPESAPTFKKLKGALCYE